MKIDRMLSRYSKICSLVLVSALVLMAWAKPGVETDRSTLSEWPNQVVAVDYRASIDQSEQPMMLYVAKGEGKRPLLVALHTWSGDYKQGGRQPIYAEWCIQNDWHFVHPHFRGPNNRPEATGSEQAIQDIVDSVRYMENNHDVDRDRIYLVGSSGGGFASLLVAGKYPDIWAGVSAWVPIVDLEKWWRQTKDGKYSRYAAQIESSVGGRPDESDIVVAECVKRSAITYLANAKGVNVDINAGIYDGSSGGSVPFTHSLYAFNELADEDDILAEDFIEYLFSARRLPVGVARGGDDSLYGEKSVVFRRSSENVRVTLFNGGHEIIPAAALNWLAAQRKGREAVWEIEHKGVFEKGKGMQSGE